MVWVIQVVIYAEEKGFQIKYLKEKTHKEHRWFPALLFFM